MLRIAAGLATFVPLLSAQTVLVVDDDPGPGVDHATIQAAVDAAPPGAIVLVRAGSYAELLDVVAKPLVLQAEPNVTLSPISQVRVRDLAPGDEVVIRGFEIDGTGSNSNEILLVDDCQGDVLVEDCVLLGSTFALFTTPNTVVVRDSARVLFRGCTIVGGAQFDLTGAGILATGGAEVFVHDCAVVGGLGGEGGLQPGGEGGPAVSLADGFLFASESTFTGGRGGGSGSIFGCGGDGGAGGPALRLGAGAPQAFLRNTALVGGEGGEPLEGCPQAPGPTGPPTDVASGTLAESTEPPHSVLITSPVRTDELAFVGLNGAPGELAVMLFSMELAPLHLPALFDVLVPGLPLKTLTVGALDGNGVAATLVQPVLPPGVDGRRIFVQPLFLDAGAGVLTLGAPTTVVVLDPAF